MAAARVVAKNFLWMLELLSGGMAEFSRVSCAAAIEKIETALNSCNKMAKGVIIPRMYTKIENRRYLLYILLLLCSTPYLSATDRHRLWR